MIGVRGGSEGSKRERLAAASDERADGVRDLTGVDLHRLQVLCTVAEAGSLTAAGQRLNYTTSAISQQISRLEREVGADVLIRHARGIKLTDAGQILIEHTARITSELAAAAARLRGLGQLAEGRVMLASVPTMTSSHLPRVARRMRDRYPNVELDVVSVRLPEIYRLLAEYRVDLGIVWHYSDEEFEAGRTLQLAPLFEDPTMVVVPATHPIAERRTVSIADLRGERFVTRRDDERGDLVLNRAARAHGFVPRTGFEANDYSESQALVSSGLGVALMPGLSLTSVRNDLVVRPVAAGQLPTRCFLAAWPGGARLSAAAAAVIDLLRSPEDTPAPEDRPRHRPTSDVPRFEWQVPDPTRRGAPLAMER